MNIPKRYWMVVGTFLLAMLLYIDRILISVAKTDVAGSLSLSEKEMGWCMSAFSIRSLGRPVGAALCADGHCVGLVGVYGSDGGCV
jgi:sugar phosphate permease